MGPGESAEALIVSYHSLALSSQLPLDFDTSSIKHLFQQRPGPGVCERKFGFDTRFFIFFELHFASPTE